MISFWLGFGAGVAAFLAGWAFGASLSEAKARAIRLGLEATIRTLENQLSALADHASALEKQLVSQNPQNDSLNPVPPPDDGQVVEEPQQQSKAQHKKRTEDRS